MRKRLLILGIATLSIIPACSGTAPAAPIAPETTSPESPEVDSFVLPAFSVSPLPNVSSESGTWPVTIAGLEIAYVRDGDLWLWMDGIGAQQLTASGDVSDVRISDDGRIIAFTRGQEIWAIRSDGSNQHLLVRDTYLKSLMQENGTIKLADFNWFPGKPMIYFSTYLESSDVEYPQLRYDTHLVDVNNGSPTQWLGPGDGGKLSVSPNGNLVAVSSPDRIDLIDLQTSNRKNLLTYPKIAVYETDFSPQVVWMPDSSGFKTVIPSQTENGVNLDQARFLYVSLGGVVASLSIFDIVPLYESQLSISPDGGYVLYVWTSADGQRELRLLDSSGAMKAYRKSPQQIRALAWSPDSKRFFYSIGDNYAVYMGGLDDYPVVDLDASWSAQWVSDQYYILQKGEAAGSGLYLGNLEAEKIYIDQSGNSFDIKIVK